MYHLVLILTTALVCYKLWPSLPFCQWGNPSLQRLGDLSSVTSLVGGVSKDSNPGCEPQSWGLHHHLVTSKARQRTQLLQSSQSRSNIHGPQIGHRHLILHGCFLKELLTLKLTWIPHLQSGDDAINYLQRVAMVKWDGVWSSQPCARPAVDAEKIVPGTCCLVIMGWPIQPWAWFHDMQVALIMTITSR